MAKFELKLPKMGESVAEATITSWLKEVGDTIELDEAVLEIATDKVDSEVPSEFEGVLVEKFFNVDDVVQVGEVLAIIETDGDVESTTNTATVVTEVDETEEQAAEQIEQTISIAKETVAPIVSNETRFYSPLVKNIAKAEGISQEDLDAIVGTGKDNRVTKADILNYIDNRGTIPVVNNVKTETPVAAKSETAKSKEAVKPVISSGEDEIIEMTRMGKLVAHHMQASIQTSAHVQSFIEADVTNVWNWRKKVKDGFMKREGENLTFTPIFMEAIAKALRDYPMMNISLQGDTIIKKKNINLGMAAALPDGNLIVPVIKNADQLNLVGMTKQVNDLANRARLNQLKPDDVQGGTYTVTNVGTFGSIMGTPIINQPQVGILALGAIRKVPAVIETPEGDFIGIRYKMFLSHSYDHRVVNGALGGMFVKAVSDYLEAWDINREI
ncbi:dihydrolipoamide acetyltransferase family protein [Algibacter lectus]|uniref:Dihydrolipoamide acetyltransferase component of pyruvate dehydrogenase complex n=1 Tax=Algibacter lectus TaxID=221126 RepID=A0A4R8MMZ6_9FLAO|nr:dihydrolipoamide acetyltransferase family protein [Algibacter lectus]MWW26735.1 2-oxo acid dehydrogenase subunit E2 [Algibacter lectus]TDY65473.1 2-oxoglutarate dehydrogenase E2 component (dihydrolipoamide succinyltransferase) [Algibacter lectus]